MDPLVRPLNSTLAEDERVNGRRFANQIIQWLDGHMQKEMASQQNGLGTRPFFPVGGVATGKRDERRAGL